MNKIHPCRDKVERWIGITKIVALAEGLGAFSITFGTFKGAVDNRSVNHFTTAIV